MSENNINAHCSICGKGYYLCKSCSEQKNFKPWRTVTDTVEHYKIFLAVHGYSTSKNKQKAKDELEKCDLSELESFNDGIKNVIKEIMAEEKTVEVETETENKEIQTKSFTKNKSKKINNYIKDIKKEVSENENIE